VPRALRALRFGWWTVTGVILGGSVGAVGCSAVKAGAAGESTTFGDAGTSIGSSGGSAGEVDASVCSPSDVSAYVPSSYQAAVPPSAACLGADGGANWDAFFDACLGPDKSKDACDAFTDTPSNAACAACVLTSYTSAALGPIVDYGDFVGGNVAGCIEVTTPPELPCAKAVQALTDCETAACQANCPVSDLNSLSARESCSMDADDAGCSSFHETAASCRAIESDAGLATPCMDGAFKDFYDAVVPLFCGSMEVDAGVAADASADAASAIEADGGERDDDVGPIAADASAD
jgi:hypothetical protein